MRAERSLAVEARMLADNAVRAATLRNSREFISAARVGDSLVRYVYLHKLQNQAIRWILTFYQATDGWAVNGVSFDDQIDLLFGGQ